MNLKILVNIVKKDMYFRLINNYVKMILKYQNILIQIVKMLIKFNNLIVKSVAQVII